MLEADELKVVMRVACQFDAGLEVNGQLFETIRDVLTALDLGRIILEVIPQPVEL